MTSSARDRAIEAAAAAIDNANPVAHDDETARIEAESAVDALLANPAVLRALADQTTPAEPGYERIADAIFHACEAAGLDLIVTRGFVPVDGPEAVLARVLDKAGLIDTSDVPAAATTPTDDGALRAEIAALFRSAPGETRLGDEPPGVIADRVLELLGRSTEETT
jgi:predicted TIM-barrel fold metal-dependent hydrolase